MMLTRSAPSKAGACFERLEDAIELKTLVAKLVETAGIGFERFGALVVGSEEALDGPGVGVEEALDGPGVGV